LDVISSKSGHVCT